VPNLVLNVALPLRVFVYYRRDTRESRSKECQSLAYKPVLESFHKIVKYIATRVKSYTY